MLTLSEPMEVCTFKEKSGGGGETVGEGVRRRGKCKWFNIVKGYGFITPDDGGPDVFLHQTAIEMPGFRSLAEGEEVEFECRPSNRGLEATIVTGVEGAACKGSDRRPVSKKRRKVRCYNCGEMGGHVAARCPQGPLPKRCHVCKSSDHLVADCPQRSQSSPGDPSEEPSEAASPRLQAERKATTSESCRVAGKVQSGQSESKSGRAADAPSSKCAETSGSRVTGKKLDTSGSSGQPTSDPSSRSKKS